MEATDELDYHITFPSPLPTSSDDEDSSPGKNVEPVVILLGWLGCQDKHLAKYSAIYEQRCITIRYIASAKDIFITTKNLKTIAGKLLELLNELQLIENPIIIHMFSNGGGFLYNELTRLIHEKPEQKQCNIIGIILDSCPSKRKPLVAAKALMGSMPNVNIILRYFAAILLLFLIIVKVIYHMLTSFFSTGSAGEDPYWHGMLNDKSTCPQLFLYSKKDAIVDYRVIEEMKRYRESRGIRVLSTCWEDTEHVGHLKVHREVYTKQCHDFLDLCLGTDYKG